MEGVNSRSLKAAARPKWVERPRCPILVRAQLTQWQIFDSFREVEKKLQTSPVQEVSARYVNRKNRCYLASELIWIKRKMSIHLNIWQRFCSKNRIRWNMIEWIDRLKNLKLIANVRDLRKQKWPQPWHQPNKKLRFQHTVPKNRSISSSPQSVIMF